MVALLNSVLYCVQDVYTSSVRRHLYQVCTVHIDTVHKQYCSHHNIRDKLLTHDIAPCFDGDNTITSNVQSYFSVVNKLQQLSSCMILDRLLFELLYSL